MHGDCLTKEYSLAVHSALEALLALMSARDYKMPVTNKTAASRSINAVRRVGSGRRMIYRAALLAALATFELASGSSLVPYDSPSDEDSFWPAQLDALRQQPQS